MASLQPQTASSSSLPATYSTSRQSPLASTSNTAAASGNPATPLRPVVGKGGFTFPAIWSFPPFFTIQPNPQTQQHQLNLWTSLVLSWAKAQRVWSVSADSQDPGEVFDNKAIRRRLLPAGIRLVLAQMVKDGQAVADPPKQTTTYLLYWRKPDEWGNLIYDWVSDNGLLGTIMTFYEVTDGDLSYQTDFREMPAPLLRKALDTLVKSGRAQVLKGDGEAGEGVRFLS